jgi:alkanesulfonate monooxygenase SsuD/methylene tetrahydromethanopterin reductase-like flavin-dependent oxidoreductase (luciferase family)
MEEAIRLIKCMWQEPRATFHGKYFHIQDAILEPKPLQKPHPPIMIGGSGEQITLRAVARVGDMCNIFGDPDTVKHKFDILRRHCENEKRNFDEIERTNLTGLLIARDEAALKTKREKYGVVEGFRVNALTVPQAVDFIGRYQQIGSQIFIFSTYKNDRETLELFASDVMPHFQ